MGYKGGFITFNKKGYKPKLTVDTCKEGDTPLGISLGTIIEGYRVKISMFRFKFNTRGDSVNFCVKHDISLKREYRLQFTKIWMPIRGDVYFNEKGERKVWE